MAEPRDLTATLRDGTTDLTATETLAGKKIQGTPHHGMSMVIDIPSGGTGADRTLNAKIQESSDDVTYNDLVVYPQIGAQSGQFIRRFYTRKDYVRCVLTVAGTSPNYGGVKVYMTKDDLNT